MARKRQRKKDRAREEDPHGDGMGEQGDLLASGAAEDADAVEDSGDGREGGRSEPPVEADPSGSEGSEPQDGGAVDGEAGLRDDPEEESEAGAELDPEPDPGEDAAPEVETGRDEEDASEAAASPDESREVRARARRLVEAGRVREAVDIYRRLVVENPRDLKARNNLGVLYDELGQHELALEQLDAAAEVDPEHVEVMTNRGAALTALGRFAEAEEELRRAQRIHPEDVGVRTQLGILFFRRGLYAQAEAELRWVCDRAEEHGPAHYYRGEALNRLGRVDAAIEALERAIALQPGNQRAYYTLGILFDLKHMPDEAARMYRKSRELQG